MTFNDLRYIVVIAEENSITKAADKLYMTQPALSQYLKKVEKELGVLIFERTTTGVRPTAEGVQFLAFAKNVLNQEQDMKKQLQNLRGGDVGEVRLGFTGTIMPYKQLSAELKNHRRYYIDPKYSVPYSFVAAVRKNAYIPHVVQRLIEELHLKQYTF